MRRVKMARVEDLAPGQIIEKMILARRVAVVNDNGTIRGIQSECAHMRASLAQGGIRDGVLTCNWRGWKYDLATGEYLTTPGVVLKAYPVEIENGEIFIVL